jgi:hypothetical protein
MSTERETTRIVRSWLEEGVTTLPDRVLDVVLDQVPATPQRRSWWPARRFPRMNSPVRYAIAAAAVLVVALAGYQLLPTSNTGSDVSSPGAPTGQVPSISSSPRTTSTSSIVTVVPFGPCPPPDEDPGCVNDDPRDDSITFTFEMPNGWHQFEGNGPPWIDGNGPPDGASVWFYSPGASLYSDVCRPPNDEEAPDIRVGPTVDDFVTALVEHPSLDVTAPVDVTLAGYSGKYVDLTIPDDISDCDQYKPIDGHIYAQGPSQRWHIWVLDVDGVRVLVESNDFPGTDAQRLGEIDAIIESLEITA